MNLSNIITLYHSGQLPHMVATLEQYLEDLKNAENIAFEAWRTNTNPTTCRMLVKEQELYKKIQLAILKKLTMASLQSNTIFLPAFHNL